MEFSFLKFFVLNKTERGATFCLNFSAFTDLDLILFPTVKPILKYELSSLKRLYFQFL